MIKLTNKINFSETIEGFDDLWLVGDNFMASTYREHFIRRKVPWFMKKQYELNVFCKSRFTSNDTNILSRIINSVNDGLKSRVKLPKVIVMVLHTDIVQYIQERITQDDAKVTIDNTLYGTWMEWLADKIMEKLEERNTSLPDKARRGEQEPIIYWVPITNHKNLDFEERSMVVKFNQTLASVTKTHKNMRIIKLKEWNYDDSTLISPYGRLTHLGVDRIWEAIDSSVKYNLDMRSHFLSKPQLKNEQGDPMYEFFKTHKVQMKAKSGNNIWSKNGRIQEDQDGTSKKKRFWLPRPKRN